MHKRLLALALSCVSIASVAAFNAASTGHSYGYVSAGTNGDLFAATTTPDAGSEEYAVVRLTTPVNNSTGREELIAEPLVPLNTQINGRPKEEENPIRTRNIYNLSTYGDLPVLVLGETADTARTIAMIADPIKGLKVLTNTATIRDAAGAGATTIKKAVGGVRIVPPTRLEDREQRHPVVFAAVTPSDSANFAGQDAAGIALLYSKTTGLVPIDATGNRGDAQAAQLNSASIKIGDTGAIAGVTCMHWDNALQRLYVGLQTTDGGVAVVMGRLNIGLTVVGETMQGDQKVTTYAYDATLALRPIIGNADATNPDAFWETTQDLIVGDKNNGITVQSLNTMHTSTQRSYLIVGRNDNAVYSVPLVKEASATTSEAQVGTAANITDTTKVPTEVNTATLHTLGTSAAQVGAGDAPANIEHVFVKGDAVFVSCAGTTAKTCGIFVSRPLFVSSGLITRWSKWQKVYGGTHKSYGFSIDNLARTHLITGDDTDTRTRLYVAGWGDGFGNGLWGGTAAAADGGLIADINENFKPANGGVSAVRLFASPDIESDWLDVSSQLGNTITGCVLGKNSLALFNTYRDSKIVGTQNSDYEVAYDSDEHFQFCDLAVDDLDLGTLTCAALAVSDGLTNEGYLAVGGAKGVGIYFGLHFSKPGLPQGVFEGPGIIAPEVAAASFKELLDPDGNSFTSVRALHWQGQQLYILTAKGLYKLDTSEDFPFFVDTPNAFTRELIATPATLLGSKNHSFLDFLVVGEHAFLATTGGLWVPEDTELNAVADQLGTGGWREVFVKDTDSFGVCAKLSFVPAAALASGGNLEVLTADVSLNVATVYCVAVPNGDLVTGYATVGAVAHGTGTPWYYSSMLGQLRECFYTNGGVAIDAGSYHHTETNGAALVRILPITPQLHNIDRWVYALVPDLRVTDPQHTVGTIVRDPATGTLLIPTISGLRVLQ